MKEIWRVVGEHILSVPERGCPVCGRTAIKESEKQWPKVGEGQNRYAPLCPACTTAYICPGLKRCAACGKLITYDQEATICQDCRKGKGPQSLDKVTALGAYSGEWKELIWRIKFQAQPRLIADLRIPLIHWVTEELSLPDGIVPVPMHQDRLAERGFNQAEVLGSLLHWSLGIPILSGLERIFPTISQVSLSRAERLQNLKMAFAVTGGTWNHKTVWLVDDVTTTGATLEACAEVLKAAGAERVECFCLASGLEKTLVSGGI